MLRADVERVIGPTLGRLEDQAFQLRRREIDRLIDQYLLDAEAGRRGVTLRQLLQREVDEKVVPPTEGEIAAALESNSWSEGRSVTPAQARERLEQRAKATKLAEFAASLRAHGAIEILLTPPVVPRVRLETEGAASRGPADAPVTIVQFGDYYCGFCQREVAVLETLQRQYPDRLRFVYRNLPLDSHPHARAAAEAAWCAQQQGKFSSFHDGLVHLSLDGTPHDLSAVARRAGLDPTAFDTCRASAEAKSAIEKDVAEAMRLEVSGTPVFFVNGRRVVGAVPAEVFSRIIDEELRTPASQP